MADNNNGDVQNNPVDDGSDSDDDDDSSDDSGSSSSEEEDETSFAILKADLPRYQRLRERRRQDRSPANHVMPPLRRVPNHELKRRARQNDDDEFAPKYPIGTKVCITDSIQYENYEQEFDIRIDGSVVGYERVHSNPQNEDEIIINRRCSTTAEEDNNDVDVPSNRYEWRYLIRFICHDHVFEYHPHGTSNTISSISNDNNAMDVDDNNGSSVGAGIMEYRPQQQQKQQKPHSFIKIFAEKDVTESLSSNDISYAIDYFFGRDLRECIQIRAGVINLETSLVKKKNDVDWNELFEELDSNVNLARARFPLYSNVGSTVGDFTILAMTLLILILNDEDEDEDDDIINSNSDVLDDAKIIKKLLSVYPKGIEQGRYHDTPTAHRHLKPGSKYLGVLHFILEYDNCEDRSLLYFGDPDTQPNYLSNRIEPDVLKLLLTTPFSTVSRQYSSSHGQYIATDYCPRRQNVVPIHRFMYSAWVTSPHRTRIDRRYMHETKKNYLAAASAADGGRRIATTYTMKDINTIDDWILAYTSSLKRSSSANAYYNNNEEEDGFVVDGSVLSPQVRTILRNNWPSVAFLLSEQFVGTMNYSSEVLNFLLYDCIDKTATSGENNNDDDAEKQRGADTTTKIDVDDISLVNIDTVFNGYIHKGGGGIVKWFTDYCKFHVPNSLIAIMFKHVSKRNKNLFHSCLKVYTDSDQHPNQLWKSLIVPPIVSLHEERRRTTSHINNNNSPAETTTTTTMDDEEQQQQQQVEDEEGSTTASLHAAADPASASANADTATTEATAATTSEQSSPSSSVVVNHYTLTSPISSPGLKVLKEMLFPLPTPSTITLAGDAAADIRSNSRSRASSSAKYYGDEEEDAMAVIGRRRERSSGLGLGGRVLRRDINDNTDPMDLLETVLIALAIVQRNMVALPFLSSPKKPGRRDETTKQPKKIVIRKPDIIAKHSKIVGSMWMKYYTTFWLVELYAQPDDPNHHTPQQRRKRYRRIPFPPLPSGGSGSGDGCRRRHPLYTAIRRNHPYRPIVRDILSSDRSVVMGYNNGGSAANNNSGIGSGIDNGGSFSSNKNSSEVAEEFFLTPFAYAATRYCSNALTEPIFPQQENENDLDGNPIERIYELLRSNPAAVQQQQHLSTTLSLSLQEAAAAEAEANTAAVVVVDEGTTTTGTRGSSSSGGRKRKKVPTVTPSKRMFEDDDNDDGNYHQEKQQQHQAMMPKRKRRKSTSVITPDGKKKKQTRSSGGSNNVSGKRRRK